MESELRHVLRPPSEDEDGALDELRIRRETEPSPALDFVPVAADVSAQSQLALFAGGSPLAAPAAPLSAPPIPAPESEGLPAFERRALLREKRRRLVGELSRRDRRTHAEINGWLNRETGVTRVEDATLDELERSCELLLDALTGRRRSVSSR